MVAWKGISLNANISSSWGGYSTYAGGSYIFMNENSLDGANLPIYWKDMFVPEDVVDDGGNVVVKQNLSAKYPNMKYSMNNEASNFWQISSFRMYLRNVSLGYTLPKEWLSKVGISSCKINVTGNQPLQFLQSLSRKLYGSSDRLRYVPGIAQLDCGIESFFLNDIIDKQD